METYYDIRQQELNVGDTVVKASRNGNSAKLEVREVVNINEKGLYLNGSNNPVIYTNLIAKV